MDFEFDIFKDKYLHVDNYVWKIDNIDFLHIQKSAVGKNGEYAIVINQGYDVVELNYRTADEMAIVNAFRSLCKALTEFSPAFKLSDSAVLINYGHVQSIKYVKNLLNSKIIVKFERATLVRNRAAKTNFDIMVQYLNDFNNTNSIKENYDNSITG